jgi:hypothetical protein
MKITIHPSAPMYTSKKGNTVYRYLVEGTKAELADYKAAKGEFHKIDESTKKPLFFSTRYAGKSAELRRTEKDDVVDFVPDDNEVRMFASLVSQYGIDVAKVIWEKDNRKAVETKQENEEKE